MIALSRMPMFGFAVLAFLLLCAILAFAVWFATRGFADPGRSRVNGPAGCAIGCALLVVAGLGALATLAVVAVNLPTEWARHGPVSRVELRYGDDKKADEAGKDPSAPDTAPRSPGLGQPARVHAEIELRPGYDAAPILRALRREVSTGLDITVRTVERDGTPRTVIEVVAPLDKAAERELRETLRGLKEELPDLDVPTGIVLEIRGPND
ncbi:MAG: hypothetical protein NTY35_11670 [Planctomycetota bacterium]|nr:hypothetical protein [Planctomycetota bacterium]